MNEKLAFEIIGQLTVQGQQFKDQAEMMINLVRKLLSREISLDSVVEVPGGFQIIPEGSPAASENGVLEEAVPVG